VGPNHRQKSIYSFENLKKLSENKKNKIYPIKNNVLGVKNQVIFLTLQYLRI
jgi:hypothetical protein